MGLDLLGCFFCEFVEFLMKDITNGLCKQIDVAANKIFRPVSFVANLQISGGNMKQIKSESDMALIRILLLLYFQLIYSCFQLIGRVYPPVSSGNPFEQGSTVQVIFNQKVQSLFRADSPVMIAVVS